MPDILPYFLNYRKILSALAPGPLDGLGGVDHRTGEPDPHHLSAATRQLLARGDLVRLSAATRGGRSIPVLFPTSPANTPLAVRPQRDAAARKRLLQGRYIGWTQGWKGHTSLIGPAGESAARSSLREVAPDVGLRLLNGGHGQVGHLLGTQVPVGPLDAAAHLMSIDEETGTSGQNFLLPIEVKNIRSWVYPWSAELYQLLNKAALLQVAHPDQLIVPVLICRRAHYTTFEMARDLGFFVVEARAQFIDASSLPDPLYLEQVRTGLGYLDLTADLGPHQRIIDGIRRLPPFAPRTAERWNVLGSRLADHFDALREGREGQVADRRAAMDGLRHAARALGSEVSW